MFVWDVPEWAELGAWPGEGRSSRTEQGEAGGRRVLAWLCCLVHPPRCAAQSLGAGAVARLEPGSEHSAWLIRAPDLGGHCLALFDAAGSCARSSDVYTQTLRAMDLLSNNIDGQGRSIFQRSL